MRKQKSELPPTMFNPASVGEARLDAFQRIKSLQDQIQKEVEAVKVDLAKQLDKACGTFKLLLELGVNDPLSDPQYAEFVNLLYGAIKAPSAPKAAAAPKRSGGRGRAKGGVSIADAVLKALESGNQMQVGAIVSRVGEIRGGKVSPASINQALMKLKKEGKIESPGRGQYIIKK